MGAAAPRTWPTGMTVADFIPRQVMTVEELKPQMPSSRQE